ncbi:MAG: Holliday junction branch migration protein RuvA, partial [Fusobacterium sp.]
MFDFLRGKVDYKTTNYVAIDVNGVGYKVFISLRTYDLISDGEDIKVYIYNHIKEEEFKLVGFLNRAERNLFEMLLSVKGVGVSLALAIMSTFDIDTT